MYIIFVLKYATQLRIVCVCVFSVSGVPVIPWLYDWVSYNCVFLYIFDGWIPTPPGRYPVYTIILQVPSGINNAGYD